MTEQTKIKKSKNQAYEDLILQGVSYNNFINAIRSQATRNAYEISIKRYMNHLKITNTDDLLPRQEVSKPRLIESQIIDYIMSLRQEGVSYSTIKFLIAPVFTFYQLNDVVLNRAKVIRYVGEPKKVVRDSAYTAEQIQITKRRSANENDYIDTIIYRVQDWGATRT